MSKPTIGDALTLEQKVKKQEIKELTVLKGNSKESIYSLVFSESENGSSKNNEQ